jgi:hypothetical protein
MTETGCAGSAVPWLSLRGGWGFRWHDAWAPRPARFAAGPVTGAGICYHIHRRVGVTPRCLGPTFSIGFGK